MTKQELVEEVLRLTLLWQQQEAGDEELARLERLLLDHPNARQIYLSVADDTVALSEVAGAQLTSLADRAAANDHNLRPAAAFGRFGVLAFWAVTAVCCAGLLGWAVLQWSAANQRSVVADNDPIGKVINTEDVCWAAGTRTYQAWSPIDAGGSLRLEAGRIEVAIDSGIQIILEGPADIQFKSRHALVVRQGELVARVGPAAIGFRIETPHAQVIDLGTSFGVAVTPGRRTDVVVYNGAVDLSVTSSKGNRDGTERRLVAGEAVSVAETGSLNRIANVEEGLFLPPPELRRRLDRRGPIQSVADDMVASDTAKYYRIRREGIREDSQAFVDRLHQWNGLDDRGIPECLAGAEYAMTFNDDKVRTDLRVRVTLAEPVRVFVLIDDRIPTPAWLQDAFVDSGQDIGLDEGYDPRRSGSSRRTSAGPGNSIDRIFSVWQCDVPTPKEIILGPVTQVARDEHPRDVGQCMYGIAAKPLRELEKVATRNVPQAAHKRYQSSQRAPTKQKGLPWFSSGGFRGNSGLLHLSSCWS